jgi:hypothetical protein
MAELKLYSFNNKYYYLSDDVYNLEPNSFIGCSKSTRTIIKNKKLNEKDYIFMKYIKSKNEWLISEDKYKSAKLFLTKEWTTNNLVIFKKDDDKTEEDLKIESLKAPPILNITDDEKFVDIDGNKLDIEIRGTRNMNDIYFKVKDVSDKFKLDNIQNTLLHPDSKFIKLIHYKVFRVKYMKSKTQKLLFLTFRGFLKLINNNKKIVDNNIYIMTKWLYKMFDNKKINKYMLEENINYKNIEGYIYCITSPLNNSVKLGCWGGEIDGLIKRYTTYYGKDLELNYKKVFDYRTIEKQMLEHFDKYKISNQLFLKENKNQYIEYINKLEVNNIEKNNTIIDSSNDDTTDDDTTDYDTTDYDYFTDDENYAIKCNTNKISCIYLLTLGYVKDLRKEMNINDNFNDIDIVCKYGFTDNLDRRLMEHKTNFSKIENVDVKLKYYTFIDNKELSKAENNMKNIFNFNNSIIQYQEYKEIIILSKKNLEFIKEEYEKCRRLFNGDQEENLKLLDFLKNQLIIKDKDIEILQDKLKSEIKNKELQIINKQLEIDLLTLKNQILIKDSSN